MTCNCNPRKHGEMYFPSAKAVCCIYCRQPIEGQVQCKCGKIVIPGEVHNCPKLAVWNVVEVDDKVIPPPA